MSDRLRWWLRRDREERDLEEEIQAHIAMEVRERLQGGEAPRMAWAEARRVFGNLGRIREETREAWGWSGLERFFDDLRQGLRILRRTPVWTAVVGATLALGIGLSSAIFSAVYGLVLKPLPYLEPDRLMAVWNSPPAGARQPMNVNGLSWRIWRERSKSFEDIALARLVANFNLTGDGTPERLQGARTSWNLPHVLGVAPLTGRVFTEAEQLSDAKVAVLSYWLWQRRFGESPDILGKKISLNGEGYEVIGVMPASFQYPTAQFELWTPLYLTKDDLSPGLNYNFAAVGRLTPGVTVAQAQAEMSAINRQISSEYPASYRTAWGYLDAIVEPLLTSNTNPIRSTMWVLLGAVTCLLLTGCFNLAILLIVRSGTRAKELAVRAALGASGSRLRRQILVEVIPLSIAGAAGGILLAWLLLRYSLPLLPQLPRIESVGLNLPVLAFAAGISMMVVILAALPSARSAAKIHLAGVMQQHTRSIAGAGGARSILVIGQVAVTIVLLFGGALLARSLTTLLHVDPGFSTHNVLTMHLAVTRAKHPTDPQVADYYDRVLNRVTELPGVLSAGMVNRLPLSGVAQVIIIDFENRPQFSGIDIDSKSVTPGYFAAAGIPLKRGRGFTATDREDSTPIGIIDERLARRVFGLENPLGKRFRIPFANLPWVEIVGVAGHILNDTPEKDLRPQVYWPESQRTQDRAALVVRTAGPPEVLTSAIIGEIRREDPDQPVYDVRTMDEWMSRTLGTRNVTTGLVGFFGGASLVLACLGIYGVVSHTAGLRLREFGIRMALGGTAGHVRGIVLGQAGRLVVSGCIVGLILALLSAKVIAGLLYGVSNVDQMALFAAPGALVCAAFLACAGPAWRASRTDPAVTLRLE
jgi:predicted permease